MRFKHPLYDMHEHRRYSPVYLADYVEATSGTGIVHSAPAYGVDDFVSCKKHGMSKRTKCSIPVQGDGTYASWLPFFAGMNIWQANPKILDTLRVAGALLSSGEMTHSYMHCWRHKTPLIYRATNQWFIRMDEANADTQGVINKKRPEGSATQDRFGSR